MKKIIKIVGIGFLGFIIFVVAIAILFPISPEVSIASFKDKDEVTSDLLDVSGKYKGSPDKILVNGQEAEKKISDSTFKKIVALKPGNNFITVEAYSKGKVAYKTEATVFYDLEGKIYLEKEKEYTRQQEEEQKELTRVPQYEFVRREGIDGGFSAIVYTDISKDYLVANTVKDIKSKNIGDNNISLLIFSKDEKQNVESLLEDTDSKVLSNVSGKVRAEYSKTSEGEELFSYPSGLEGDKIALGL